MYYFFPPPNQFKYYLKSQPRFLSVLQHAGTARTISTLSLTQARSLLAFLFLESSVNHCVTSATQTLILPMLVCNGVLVHRALNAEVGGTKASAAPGTRFPPAPPQNSFRPPQGVLQRAVPSWRSLTSFRTKW